MPAKVLVVGGGGREHALGWKIAQSPEVEQVFFAPGNAGTTAVGKNVPIGVKEFDKLKDFAVEEGVSMVVVGPEDPLCLGLHDAFEADARTKDIVVVGPKKAGAELEASKGFSKAFMARHNIPTAAYKSFNGEQVAEGQAYLETLKAPFVLKADGLAAGKGVLICQTLDEAKASLAEMLGGKFGNASSSVVIEEFLAGDELSVFVVIDSKGHYALLPTSCDFKRAGDNDTGLNTGGMGAVSPCPFADAELMARVDERIVAPTVRGLVAEQLGYTGFLYVGLMNCGGDPFVVEYNCRLGDPETEAVLPRITSDLYPVLASLKSGTLDSHKIETDARQACTVILASGGYPGSYPKGKVISGLADAAPALVFHAGTTQKDADVVTSGGRVLAVTALADTLAAAQPAAYAGVSKIQWEGVYFRTDIAKKFL